MTGFFLPSQDARVISPDWLARPATEVAPDLIGCWLLRSHPDHPDQPPQPCRIVETEAYRAGDPACHAYRKRTARNAVMFGPPGYSYVYLIYGIYHCFNVVVEPDGAPAAVLIRALEPVPPIPHDRDKPERVAAGPGKLCRALALDRSHSGLPLTPASGLWLEHRRPADQPLISQPGALVQTTRIGLTQGVDLPWRWYLNASASVSKR